MYMFRSSEATAAQYAKYGIKLETTVTPEMATAALDSGRTPRAFSLDAAERFFNLLGNRQDQQRYLVILAKENMNDAEALAKKYNFSGDSRVEILANRDRDGFRGDPLVPQYVFDSDSRVSKFVLFELLKGKEPAKAMPLLRSFSRQDRVEALLMYLNHANTSQNALQKKMGDLEHFGLSEVKDRLMVAGEIFRLCPQIDLQLVATALRFNGSSTDGIQRARFAENIDSVLENFVQETENRQMNPNAPAKELIETLEKYARIHPKVLPPGLTDALCTTYRRREVVIPTLTLYYRLHGYMMPGQLPTGPFETWSQGLGLPLEDVKKGAKSELFGDVIDLALATQQTLREAPYKNLTIPANYFEKNSLKKLSLFFGALRDWLRLAGNDREAWRKILQQLEQESNGNMDRRLEIAGNILLHEVRTLFGASDLKITLEQFQDLQNRWKDVAPITTLAARFSRDWEGTYKTQLSALADIFRAILEDRFYEFKFKYKSQISFFNTSEKLAEWTKIRNRLDLYTPGQSQSVEPISMKEVLAIVHSNIAHHFEGWESVASKPELLEFVREAKGEATETLQKIKNRFYAGDSDVQFFSSLKRDVITTLIKETTHKNLETAIWILNKYKGELGLDGDLAGDIRDIKTKLARYTVTTDGQALVFTTNVWDAKSMLRIGKFVRATSCMNYMVGTHAYALMSYVEHAGTQGVISLVAEKSKFYTTEEFELVKEARNLGKLQDVHFEPNEQVIEFRVGDRVIKTRPFLDEEAFNRHIMKAGAVGDNGSGIMLERAYRLEHVADPIIKAQVRDLLTEVAAGTGSTLTGLMRFAPPANSVGIYSDAGQGIMKTEYRVTVEGGFAR